MSSKSAKQPTVEDYSRLLDDVLTHLIDQVVEADRAGDTRLAERLRTTQTYVITQRSKRNL